MSKLRAKPPGLEIHVLALTVISRRWTKRVSRVSSRVNA
jgi:hypothetical protein